MSALHKLILASGSPRRVELLQQAGIQPDYLAPANIDETPGRNEHPRNLAKRLSREKAEKAASSLKNEPYANGAFILAADTVVAVGRRVLPKAELMDEANYCLHLLSGRTHHVYTGVMLVTPAGRYRQKLVETKVRFKRLTKDDINAYLATGEWRGVILDAPSRREAPQVRVEGRADSRSRTPRTRRSPDARTPAGRRAATGV